MPWSGPSLRKAACSVCRQMTFESSQVARASQEVAVDSVWVTETPWR